jgi:hypothetical protein
MGPRTGLDVTAKRKHPSPCRESNPGRPFRSLVTIPTELPCSVIKAPEKLSKHLSFKCFHMYRENSENGSSCSSSNVIISTVVVAAVAAAMIYDDNKRIKDWNWFVLMMLIY